MGGDFSSNLELLLRGIITCTRPSIKYKVAALNIGIYSIVYRRRSTINYCRWNARS